MTEPMSMEEWLEGNSKLDRERHERWVEQQNVIVSRMIESVEKLFTQQPKPSKEDMRRNYVRNYAPFILAGLIASTNGEKSLGRVRELAIEQAGLIFDETEEA